MARTPRWHRARLFARGRAARAAFSPAPSARPFTVTVATDVSRAFNGGTHCSTHCSTHCYTFDVSEDLVRRERRGSARGRSVCVSVGVAWCRRCAIAARASRCPGCRPARRRRRVLFVSVLTLKLSSSVRRSDAVASSEKSIYNRNSSRSLAARYAERIHTPARAHNGFVRSVFERKLTDGRSGLTSHRFSRPRARAARALYGTTGVGRSPERRAL